MLIDTKMINWNETSITKFQYYGGDKVQILLKCPQNLLDKNRNKLMPNAQ